MEWTHPRTKEERFVPNEAIAACGDSGTVYLFNCNAGLAGGVTDDMGEPVHDHHPYRVFRENGQEFLPGNGYGRCGVIHEAPTDGIFVRGYMDNMYTAADEHIAVIIWGGWTGNEVHCTTDLDMSTWETTRS